MFGWLTGGLKDRAICSSFSAAVMLLLLCSVEWSRLFRVASCKVQLPA